MTPRGTDVERIQRTFVDALSSESFERHGLRRGTWDVSLDCETPVPVQLYSRATGLVKNLSKHGVRAVPGIELNLLTPCRRCPVCLRRKARHWRERAIAEITQSNRTWFGTLTTRPDFDVWLDQLAASKTRNFWSADEVKKFEPRARVLGTEVTKYLKRVRKNSGCQFRYLLVTELHASANTAAEKFMRPHVHILLHEFAGQPIAKRLLDAAWGHGHCQWRLVADIRAAWYVSKYISKASSARVRASLDYGQSEIQCTKG